MSTVFTNPFVRPVEGYKRDIAPVKHYATQGALYLQQQTGEDYQRCLDFVKSQCKPAGPTPLKDKTLRYTQRNEFGDREETSGSYLGYIMDSVTRGLITAPTLTSYHPPSVVTSHHVGYIDDRIKRRKAVKKQMYSFIALDDKDMAKAKHIEQNGLKTGSNSLSGAQASMFNAIYNHSAHSTLTSNCRAISSYGSVNNEKFLAGNRHYWGHDVVFNNIAAITSRSDYPAIKAAMAKYGLHYPSAQEVLDCVKYSSDKYWTNKAVEETLLAYAERLAPAERAAFVYTGDFFHLMKYNTHVISDFLNKLSAYVHDDNVDVPGVLKKATESFRFLAIQVMDREVAGETFDSVKSTRAEKTLCSIMDNAMTAVDEYADLVKAFITTDNMPASVAYFPESIRDIVLTGDTDSTIFTVEQWVAWLNDGIVAFDQRCNAIAAAMIFLADQTIVHILALMSSHVGAPKEHIFTSAMKNEYKFPVYIPMQVGKHYLAVKSCQEGLIFKEMQDEIKGVHMKNSNAPLTINKTAKQFMLDIVADIYQSQKVSLAKYIKQVIVLEQEIMASLKRGESTYFRFQQIKQPTAYKDKNELKTPYAAYLFWGKVFAKEYGETVNPPYMAIKANLAIRNATDFKEWLAGIESPSIKRGLDEWMRMTGKKVIKTISIPFDTALNKGIPKEIMDGLDMRKTAFDMCKTFYIVLEALGQYTVFINERKRFILSDLYDIDEAGDLQLKPPSSPPIILTADDIKELINETKDVAEYMDIVDQPIDTIPDDYDPPF